MNYYTNRLYHDALLKERTSISGPLIGAISCQYRVYLELGETDDIKSRVINDVRTILDMNDKILLGEITFKIGTVGQYLVKHMNTLPEETVEGVWLAFNSKMIEMSEYFSTLGDDVQKEWSVEKQIEVVDSQIIDDAEYIIELIETWPDN